MTRVRNRIPPGRTLKDKPFRTSRCSESMDGWMETDIDERSLQYYRVNCFYLPVDRLSWNAANTKEKRIANVNLTQIDFKFPLIVV